MAELPPEPTVPSREPGMGALESLGRIATDLSLVAEAVAGSALGVMDDAWLHLHEIARHRGQQAAAALDDYRDLLDRLYARPEIEEGSF